MILKLFKDHYIELFGTLKIEYSVIEHLLKKSEL